MIELHLIKRLYAAIYPKSLLWLALILYVPLTLLSIAQPLIVGQVANLAVLDEGFKHIAYWAGIFFATIVAHALLESAQLYTLQYVGQKLVYHLRHLLFRHTQSLPIAFFDQNPLGLIITRIINNVDAISELFLSGSAQIIGDFLFIIATLVMLLIVDIKLSLLSFILLPLLAVGIFYFRKWTRHALLQVSTLLASLNSFLQERLTGMLTIQSFSAIQTTRDAFDVANDEFMKANKRAILLDAAIYAFVDTIAYCSIAIVLIAAFGLQTSQALKIGVLVAFIEALNRFFQPIRELSSRFAAFQGALVGAQRVFSFLDEKPATPHRPSLMLPALFEDSITFQQVDFFYPNGNQALFHVDFTIKKGQQVAVVGETGSGKSTIIKLLSRLYEPQKGRICLDNTNIRDIDPTTYHGMVSIVPQDVFLFEGTLRENLLYGQSNVSDDNMIQALETCQAAYLLKRPGGLEQAVEKAGRNFSLGERQLLTMTRAFLANASILLLDEATAHIDPHTERQLQIATEHLLSNKTALIVAHRLSTVEKCDHILVFSAGRLVAQGTHETLLKQEGIYRRWVSLSQMPLN